MYQYDVFFYGIQISFYTSHFDFRDEMSKIFSINKSECNPLLNHVSLKQRKIVLRFNKNEDIDASQLSGEKIERLSSGRWKILQNENCLIVYYDFFDCKIIRRLLVAVLLQELPPSKFQCLHGAAFILNNNIVLLLGNSKYGKTTLAAELRKGGFKVINENYILLYDYQWVPFWDHIYNFNIDEKLNIGKIIVLNPIENRNHIALSRVKSEEIKDFSVTNYFGNLFASSQNFNHGFLEFINCLNTPVFKLTYTKNVDTPGDLLNKIIP